MRTILLTILSMLVAGMAFAADIDGKWVGESQGSAFSFTFKADGATLTGNHVNPMGETVDIVDGKIDGDNLTFVTASNMGGQEMKINWKGVVSPDQIKLTMDMGGMGGGGAPMEFILKREK